MKQLFPKEMIEYTWKAHQSMHDQRFKIDNSQSTEFLILQ